MYAVPDVDEVVSVAKSLGIQIGPDEAVLYRKYLLEHLNALDAFVQARIEEPAPPICSAARQPGWKPSPGEDPLNAWMWKCLIAGAEGGLLAGKADRRQAPAPRCPPRFGPSARCSRCSDPSRSQCRSGRPARTWA